MTPYFVLIRPIYTVLTQKCAVSVQSALQQTNQQILVWMFPLGSKTSSIAQLGELLPLVGRVVGSTLSGVIFFLFSFMLRCRKMGIFFKVSLKLHLP